MAHFRAAECRIDIPVLVITPVLIAHSRFILLLAPLALAGCIAYHAEPTTPRQEAARFDSRNLNDPAIRQGIAKALGHTPPTWNCEALTQAAFLLHPDLELARAQLRTAQGAIRTAGAHPNPTLGFDGQITGNMLQGMKPWSLGFSLDIPIETAGKRGYRLDQAHAAAQSAALQIVTTEWQVRRRVRKSLVELYAATQRAEFLAHEQQTQDQTLRALDERVAAGEISRPELIQQRLLYNQSQLLLRDAERMKAESRAALADAVGIPASAIDSIQLDLSEFARTPEAVAADRLRSKAMLRRTDVLSALADYTASEAALHLEIAKQYPDFHFNPGYLWDQGQDKWFITPTVELPVFHHNQGPIAEATGKRAEAAAKFRAQQMKAAGEIDKALATFRGALKKLQTADSLLASQEKQKQSAEVLLKAGETDRLALLSAEVEYEATNVSRLDALAEAQQALGQLEDAAQTTLK